MSEALIVLMIALLVLPFVLKTLNIRIGFDKELPIQIWWLLKFLMLAGLYFIFLWVAGKLEDGAIILLYPALLGFAVLAIAILFASPPKTRR